MPQNIEKIKQDHDSMDTPRIFIFFYKCKLYKNAKRSAKVYTNTQCIQRPANSAKKDRENKNTPSILPQPINKIN